MEVPYRDHLGMRSTKRRDRGTVSDLSSSRRKYLAPRSVCLYVWDRGAMTHLLSVKLATQSSNQDPTASRSEPLKNSPSTLKARSTVEENSPL